MALSKESTSATVKKKKVVKKKKKVTDSSVDLVKKKKPKTTEATGTELVLHKPSGEIITSEGFEEILNTSLQSVYNLLEVNDTDNAIQLLYKRVIQSSYKMLGRLEASMDEGNGTRGAYPFNAIAGTLREYLTDLQMSMDRGRLAENILDNILRPLFLEMATTLVLQMGVIQKEAKVALGDTKYEEFNKNVIQVAQNKIIDAMQRSYEVAKEDARKALQR